MRGDSGQRMRCLGLSVCFFLLASCTVTPLTNRIQVGDEAFVIAVGEGPDGQTDLFAAPAGGGAFTRLTYSRPEERLPRISADGKSVAFLRAASGVSGPPWSLVVLDLTSNGEHAAPLPADAGVPERLGWSRDGSRVVIKAQGYYSMAVLPGAAVVAHFPADSLALADSLTREVLGEPPHGIVDRCAGGGLCIVASTGEITPLDRAASDAVRWGADSVGYFVSGKFEVRPLAGGHSRRPDWTQAPAGLRQLSYNPGQVTTSSGVSGIR